MSISHQKLSESLKEHLEAGGIKTTVTNLKEWEPEDCLFEDVSRIFDYIF